MSDCLNPDCITEYRGVMPWLDAEYCSHACRSAHLPRSEREPDLTCARKACPVVPDTTVRNAMGGYCSKTCIALDTPAPVEAWAAAVGRAIDGGPTGAVGPDAPFPPPARAVEPLTPVPAGAESTEPLNEPQGSTLTREHVAAAMDVPVESVGRGPDGSFVVPAVPLLFQPPGAGPRPVQFPAPVPRRWWARLLRRTA